VTLFDTLYHAVALEHEDALLVTADERYYEKPKATERSGDCMTGRRAGGQAGA
jgi:hypothetical protein